MILFHIKSIQKAVAFIVMQTFSLDLVISTEYLASAVAAESSYHCVGPTPSAKIYFSISRMF